MAFVDGFGSLGGVVLGIFTPRTTNISSLTSLPWVCYAVSMATRLFGYTHVNDVACLDDPGSTCLNVTLSPEDQQEVAWASLDDRLQVSVLIQITDADTPKESL